MTTVSAMTPAIRDRLVAVCSDESPEPTYRYSYVRTRSEGRGRATVVLYNPVHRGDRMDQTTGKCMAWLCGDGAIGEVEFVNLFAFRHRDPLALVSLASAGVDVIGPENDRYIVAAIERSDLVVLAWGRILDGSIPNVRRRCSHGSLSQSVSELTATATRFIRTDEALAKPHTCCHSPGLDRSQSRFWARSKCGHPVERN
jgi:hypothetical protein